MSRSFSPLEERLLETIQESIPLVPRPFAAIGEKLGVPEADVLRALFLLKSGPSPVVRQISAIFDSKALGYQTSLVAAQVAPHRLEEAAAIVNRHPGVTHNYQRQHAYNLWYTVAVPPDSVLGLEATVDRLHRQSGALATRLMPTLKLFKIGVRLKLGSGERAAQSPAASFSHADRAKSDGLVIADSDKRIIRVLQQDLPIVAEPYREWARQAGVSVDGLLSAARVYIERRCMRRFSAVLRHREAGFEANAMGVWIVPPDAIERFGIVAARFDAVSHCYLRPTYEDWPYNCFTMIHGTQTADCESVLASIAEATGVHEYGALYSLKEFKKTRVQYFTPDIGAWETDTLAIERRRTVPIC